MATSNDHVSKPSRKRTWIVSSLAVYVVGALIFLLLGGGRPDTAESTTRTPGRVHQIEFVTLDGEATSFAQYAGTPLVINFFASWCGPCVYELPEFEAFHQEYGEQFQVVGLAVEGARPARLLVADVGLTYPTGLDQDDILIDLGGVAMPTTVFVHADGTVVETHSGVLELGEIINKAQALLAS